MGFVLSIFYFVVSYLTPATIFGELGQYRIELILALPILLVSIPKIVGSYIFKTPQSLALIGLSVAVFFSILFGQRWASGAVTAFLGFVPIIYFYFLICLHCQSRRKLKIVAVVLFFVCMFVTLKGGIDLIHSRSDGNVPISARTGNIDVVQWDAAHPYLFIMNSDSDEMFYRLRGLGMINDPNDFAQLVVCVIPLMFLLWRPKKASWNFPFVILPVCALLLSVFLTHSRGALLAIIAEAVVAARRRIGIVPALALAGLLFVSAMALQFTGGRDISAGAGEDRTALWGEGLAAFKAHPIFGVGWGQLPNFTADHLTAHNSVVLCASELGLLGLFFWSLFLFPTFRDVLVIGSPKKVNEAMAVEQEEVPFPHPMTAVEELDKGEMNRAGNLLLLSLVGFVVTGWFLSRAFAVTLFLLGGMVEAVYQMTLERGMIAPRMRFSRVFAYSCVLSIGLVAAVYLMVRMAHLGH